MKAVTLFFWTLPILLSMLSSTDKDRVRHILLRKNSKYNILEQNSV
ncbi:hypothetical protein J2S04_000931 [Alicyclobacillus tengchongensis]|uniref:Uncharacterized protein n=2 Tax=Alicyclobacillus tolerans TaxID=90970 RepID=A0A1M6WEQ1_9BACL|nr:hypothetical protein [Alicyclobacillus tengchongensis]SHK92171.1 hypothetical protein SAMN05443507_12721 [Alicyclobacillus montanus]